MKRKKEQLPSEKKTLSNKKLMIASMTVVAVILLGFLLFQFFLQTPEVKFSFRAAIIDQLEGEISNPDFNETGVVSSILKDAGFNVSYHRSETIDVPFFKGLAKSDYGIIIIRAHSAQREDKTIVDFFTSERFNENEYVSDQQNGLLTQGYYLWKPEIYYFAITPKFIENLEGYFPKSVVIAMGCNSLNETCTEMAEAFIKKGAKAYIGWTGLVESSHTDNETVKLLKMLLKENKTIAEAVSNTSLVQYPPSKMNFYPSSEGNLTISDLIASAKGSAISQIAFDNSRHGCRICTTDLARLSIKKFSDWLSISWLTNYNSVLKLS